jgi:predicted NACHT family NTPase
MYLPHYFWIALSNILIDLANYLHLNSPSGLIDAFDMEHLFCLSLKQQNFSDNRIKLCQYANKLISLLETNNGIATERGLQVFGFLHLSFQEYFVAQSLIRGSSIENITDHILSFTINPRFRESLRLAIGWISWKWSFDDYENFCNLLINSTKISKIPFGTLLFFDAYNDLQRLPSNTIIFTALNNLLDHPSNIITKRYLILNLSELSEHIIGEWMQLRLKDEKYLFQILSIFSKRTL